MLSLSTFLLACLGTCFVVTRSKLFERTREIAEHIAPFASYVVRCPQCCGFWCGVAWAALGLWPVPARTLALAWFTAGCVSSIACHVVNLACEIALRAIQPAPLPQRSRIARPR